MKNYQYIDSNFPKLTGKNVLLLGATGTIGNSILDYLCYLESNVTIAVRNIEKGNNLINKIKNKYPSALIDIKKLDISSFDSIKKFKDEIKDTKYDYFIENMGIYHQESKNTSDGFEIHFETNALGPLYLLNIIKNNISNAKVIFTSSLSITFTKLDLTDLEYKKSNNLTDIYANSKNVLTRSLLALKKDYDIVIAHPGVSATNIFNGFPRIFKVFCLPLMKLIFNKPEISALSILSGLFTKTNTYEWIGPKRLFKTKGYPDVYSLPECFKDDNLNKHVLEKMNLLIEGVKR